MPKEIGGIRDSFGGCGFRRSQITSKALGMSVGGKNGVARCGGDMAVALFFGVGLGHLDEICIGLAHRAI